MIRSAARAVFHALAPPFIKHPYLRRRLVRLARRLVERTDGIQDLHRLCALLWDFPDFKPLQNVSEIVRFLETIATPAPKRVVEIGTASGGTAFLLTRVAAPDATLVLIDTAFDPAREAALQEFARARQRLTCLSADSHDPKTAERVHTLLGGDADVLFIDGDHSYEGVATDFELYRSLVRPGGTIAFHDIVPDAASRGRLDRGEGAESAGVPAFWEDVKRSYPPEAEIIEDPNQDACGIGVLRWAGRTAG